MPERLGGSQFPGSFVSLDFHLVNTSLSVIPLVRVYMSYHMLCQMRCLSWSCSTHVLQDLGRKHSRTRDLSAFVLVKNMCASHGEMSRVEGALQEQSLHIAPVSEVVNKPLVRF